MQSAKHTGMRRSPAPGETHESCPRERSPASLWEVFVSAVAQCANVPPFGSLRSASTTSAARSCRGKPQHGFVHDWVLYGGPKWT